MTQEEYIAQNSLGFEGDIFLKEEFERIILRNQTEVVIETGTFYGATTRALSYMVGRVHSIEVNRENWERAVPLCADRENITLHFGSSEKVLPEILAGIPKETKLFFFLDAHWEKYNPLLDELRIIAQHGLKPVIVVHDFKVPGTDLGFDLYNGQPYDYRWIESSLKRIYGDQYYYYYNKEATGARRGVIFIQPK